MKEHYLKTNESTISFGDDYNNSVYIDKDLSPEEMKQKYLDAVKLPNEPKYSNLVDNLFKKSDETFINKNKGDKKFDEKYQELNQYIQKLKYKKKISIEDFEKIRNYALTKGGFLTSENRKILYKKIYLLNTSNKYKMLYIDYEAQKNKYWDITGIDIFIEEKMLKDLKTQCNYEKIIEVDCQRSQILQLFKDNEGKKLAKLITADLEKFLKLMCCLNNNKYSYYQGYHDLGLYFLLLYHKDPGYGVSVFQKFSEFNLKEILNSKYKQKNLENGSYNMIEMIDTLTILKFIIEYLDPKCKNFFLECEKKDDVNFRNNIENKQISEDNLFICDFALNWIVSLFTRYFEDINNVYRIFDYLMVSNPLAIYFISAEIIVDIFNKVKDKNLIGDKAGQHQIFDTNINFDEMNFDYYIEKCEGNLKKYLGSSDFDKMIKYLNLNELYKYPLMNTQSFVEKWIITNNQKEYTGSIFNYLKYNFNLLINLFSSDK